jgi:hypothetical protein
MSFGPASTHPHPAVAIIGAGVLGRRLGFMYASHGAQVRIYDTSQESLDTAEKFIASSFQDGVHGLGNQRGDVTFHSKDLEAVIQGTWMVRHYQKSYHSRLRSLGNWMRSRMPLPLSPVIHPHFPRDRCLNMSVDPNALSTHIIICLRTGMGSRSCRVDRRTLRLSIY